MKKTWFALMSLAALGCGVGTADSNNTSTDTTMSEDELRTAAICLPAACGPQPGMPAIVCQDGSTGGFTGRCIQAAHANRCVWEIRRCPQPPPPPVQCGNATCAAGQTCCNASCGICVGPNQVCTQVVCPPNHCSATQCGPIPPTCAGAPPPTCEADAAGSCHWSTHGCPPPPPPPVPCGNTTCSSGEVCCSPSCGICAQPNGACPQIVCPPNPCTAAECGPPPPVCANGTPPTCERTPGTTGTSGTCHWQTHGCNLPPPPPPPPCTNVECGPMPGAPAYTCWDGSVGGNIGRCERVNTTGQCGWIIRACPPQPTVCPVNACGPQPGVPSTICSDGSTGGFTGRCIAGSPAGTNSTTCHWEIRACP